MSDPSGASEECRTKTNVTEITQNGKIRTLHDMFVRMYVEMLRKMCNCTSFTDIRHVDAHIIHSALDMYFSCRRTFFLIQPT